MKKGLRILLMAVISLFLVSGTALAVTIDFGYSGDPSGIVYTDGTFGSASEISINTVTVIGNPAGGNGSFEVDLYLDFVYFPQVNFIRIHDDGGGDWLTGSFSQFDVLAMNPIVIYGAGLDAKAEWLLRALCIPLDTNFAFFGFTIATSESLVGENGQYWMGGAYSVDISNNSVPEPTTILLLGFGLVGLTGVRRFKK